jgi:hypothetical protein
MLHLTNQGSETFNLESKDINIVMNQEKNYLHHHDPIPLYL